MFSLHLWHTANLGTGWTFTQLTVLWLHCFDERHHVHVVYIDCSAKNWIVAMVGYMCNTRALCCLSFVVGFTTKIKGKCWYQQHCWVWYWSGVCKNWIQDLKRSGEKSSNELRYFEKRGEISQAREKPLLNIVEHWGGNFTSKRKTNSEYTGTRVFVFQSLYGCAFVLK